MLIALNWPAFPRPKRSVTSCASWSVRMWHTCWLASMRDPRPSRCAACQKSPSCARSLPSITNNRANREANLPCLSHLWQRDYYEHVLRNADDVLLTREYILNNPLKALLRQEQRDEEVKRTMSKRASRRPSMLQSPRHRRGSC